MSKYPIFVFEGIEASGKSTSLKKTIKYLKKKKLSIYPLESQAAQIYLRNLDH